jgi:hypothetical protein
MADEPILATITGEFFQPVRLHYHVFNPEALLRTFKKLRCVDQDPPRQRWVWLYDHEARNLPFKQSYAQIPKHLRPVVIGSFFLRTRDRLLLDLRSCERAVQAVPFFDRHVSRKVAKLTEAEVVNKLFPATDSKLAPDSIFDYQGSTARDPEDTVRKVTELTAHVDDPQEKLRMAMEYLASQGKLPLPKVERLPVHFYEEGIHGFVLALRMRQLVALQHWLGNIEYTMFDAIQLIHKSM